MKEQRRPMVVYGPIHLPMSSPAVVALEKWKTVGGTYKDLILRALNDFARTEEFQKLLLDRASLSGMKEGEGSNK